MRAPADARTPTHASEAPSLCGSAPPLTLWVPRLLAARVWPAGNDTLDTEGGSRPCIELRVLRALLVGGCTRSHGELRAQTELLLTYY